MIRSGIIAMLISVFEPCGTIRHNGLWTLPDYESFGVKVILQNYRMSGSAKGRT